MWARSSIRSRAVLCTSSTRAWRAGSSEPWPGSSPRQQTASPPSRPRSGMAKTPFNRPHTTGHEFEYIQEAIDNGHLSGRGPFDKRCTDWLEQRTGTPQALLTFSCTSALEMATILAGVGEGDEVIMPSFPFVSTANAIALRGAVPVFVDIREDTLNVDEGLLEGALTDRTKVVLPVHYAGVGCE